MNSQPRPAAAHASESKDPRTASTTGVARLSMAIVLFLAMLAPSGALAAIGLNLDFGIFYGVPSAEDGAAAGRPGVWNEAPIDVTPLLDTSGVVTLAAVEVVAAEQGSSGGGNEMVRDNFYVSGGNTWSVELTGIPSGLYLVYVYAPTNTSVSSGSFTVNGQAFASLPGDDSGGYIEGASNLKTAVDVDGGAISLSGSDPGFSGLAGLQVVPVPEPGFATLLGAGPHSPVGSPAVDCLDGAENAA